MTADTTLRATLAEAIEKVLGHANGLYLKPLLDRIVPVVEQLLAAQLAHSHCSFSTGIDGAMTAGRGKLDANGYWEFPCEDCAIRAQRSLDSDRELQATLASRTRELDGWRAEDKRVREILLPHYDDMGVDGPDAATWFLADRVVAQFKAEREDSAFTSARCAEVETNRDELQAAILATVKGREQAEADLAQMREERDALRRDLESWREWAHKEMQARAEAGAPTPAPQVASSSERKFAAAYCGQDEVCSTEDYGIGRCELHWLRSQVLPERRHRPSEVRAATFDGVSLRPSADEAGGAQVETSFAGLPYDQQPFAGWPESMQPTGGQLAPLITMSEDALILPWKVEDWVSYVQRLEDELDAQRRARVQAEQVGEARATAALLARLEKAAVLDFADVEGSECRLCGASFFDGDGEHEPDCMLSHATADPGQTPAE